MTVLALVTSPSLWEKDSPKLVLLSTGGGLLAIAISNQDRAWYGWFWGNPYYINDIEQLLGNAVNCGLIYTNPVVKLYESDG